MSQRAENISERGTVNEDSMNSTHLLSATYLKVSLYVVRKTLSKGFTCLAPFLNVYYQSLAASSLCTAL